MDKFFGVVGAVLVILTAVALTAGVMGMLLEGVDRIVGRWRSDVIARRDAELGESLLSGVHWLSEEPRLAAMLEHLGESLSSGYSLYPGHWRDEFWRKHGSPRDTAPSPAPTKEDK